MMLLIRPYVTVLDHYHMPPFAVVLDRKIQIHCDFRPINVVDLAIIAYTTHKRNLIPVSKNTIADDIGMLVSYAIEVVSLTSHVMTIVLGLLHSSRMQSQTTPRPKYNYCVLVHTTQHRRATQSRTK